MLPKLAVFGIETMLYLSAMACLPGTDELSNGPSFQRLLLLSYTIDKESPTFKNISNTSTCGAAHRVTGHLLSFLNNPIILVDLCDHGLLYGILGI